MAHTVEAHSPSIAALPPDQVLAVAHSDAVQAYGDLSLYRIRLALEPDGWHVDYELKDAKLKGGGPHYIIDPSAGDIIFKRYEQ